jgi:hypothetical protein
MSIRLILVLPLLLCVSCVGGHIVDQSSAGETTFSLKVGGRVTLMPEQLEVGFRQVVSDSRCPSSVQCPWEGEGTIRLWLLKPGADSVFVDLSTMEAKASVDTLGFHLDLSKLDPYPEKPGRIPVSQYEALLKASRS